MTTKSTEITELLNDFASGSKTAYDRLFPLLYDELRQIAHGRLRLERKDHTLSTTALVHEAYFKLVDYNRIQYKGRAHFFAIMSQAMRNILVTYAIRKKAEKRGGDLQKVDVEEVELMSESQAEDILALDEALKRFHEKNKRGHRVVECRFFAGMSIEETAEALKVSPATVKRDWNLARAWLNRELQNDLVP